MRQPPLVDLPPTELAVAIAGLALGGAERIVLDWARTLDPPWTPHVIVLRDHAHEWPVPASLNVTRLHGVDLTAKLTDIGRSIAQSTVPVCVCHLLTAPERDAIAAHGAFTVPVIHNAEPGWLEPSSALDGAAHAVAVSEASAGDVLRRSRAAAVSVIRHIPAARRFAQDARERWRAAWRIPSDAVVIGMIGAVKPQKDYPFAVRLLRALLDRQNAYLAIVGGPVGRHGRAGWAAILAEVHHHRLRHRVAMPGFVTDAAGCLPAFDLLRTNPRVDRRRDRRAWHHTRAAGVVGCAGAPLRGDEQQCSGRPTWPRQVRERPACLPTSVRPSACSSPWPPTRLATTGRPLTSASKVATLSPSKSLVFSDQLCAAGVPCFRTSASRDPFDHAERLVHKVCADGIGIVCFWNVDPKIKLLVTKALAFTDVALVDVSPGPSAFAEMRGAAAFADAIVFSEDQFYRRLDRLVLKYHSALSPGTELGPLAQVGPSSVPATKRGPTSVPDIAIIPNGVASPPRVKTSYALPPRGARVVVNGRIAPAKFIVEIVDAMRLVRDHVPAAELHLFGAAEPRHAEYEAAVRKAVGDALHAWVFVHGAGARTIDALPDFDAFVVLGQDQGSPNALLEALAAGVPSVANDDGGTREQILHERTGLLIADRSPATVAAAIVRVLTDRDLAARLGVAGRQHVQTSFSLERMVARYQQLFASLASAPTREKTA